jgi:hypothetical protein
VAVAVAVTFSGGLSMTADGFWLLQDVRRWLLDLRRWLRPCIDKTVPGLAVGVGRVA